MLAGRYRLERRLAQGGMAEVWLGTDLSLTRQVAVKLLKPNLAADPVVAERFRREAIAVAQLSHPNIVAVYDAIEETIGGERRQAVVMQLVNGKSLRQLLDEQKRLSPDLTMHIGACVASALDCAHHANLVHRDVKPGNILITPDGRVCHRLRHRQGPGRYRRRRPHQPERDDGHRQVPVARAGAGRKLDGRADLYSLGLVLYECLAGRVPFLGETDADTALARLNREATDLTQLRPTLPYGLAPLIHRLLRASPTSGTPPVPRCAPNCSASPPSHGTTPTTAWTSRSPRAPRRVSRGTRPTVAQSPTPTGGPRCRRLRPAAAHHRLAAGAEGWPTRRVPHTCRPHTTLTGAAAPAARPQVRATHRTSMVLVGVLLAVVFVVGLVLWVTVGTDGGSSGSPAPPPSPAKAARPAPTPPPGATHRRQHRRCAASTQRATTAPRTRTRWGWPSTATRPRRGRRSATATATWVASVASA